MMSCKRLLFISIAYSNTCLRLNSFKFVKEFDDFYASNTEKQIMELFVAKVLCGIFLCGYGPHATCYLQSFTVIPLQKNIIFFAKIKIITDIKTKISHEFIITNALNYRKAISSVGKKREIESLNKVNNIANAMTNIMISKLQQSFEQGLIKSSSINAKNVKSFHIQVDFSTETELNNVDDNNKNTNTMLSSSHKIDIKNNDQVNFHDDCNNARMGELAPNTTTIHQEKILTNIVIPSHPILTQHHLELLVTDTNEASLSDYCTEALNGGYTICKTKEI